jgi:hypothetical protein
VAASWRRVGHSGRVKKILSGRPLLTPRRRGRWSPAVSPILKLINLLDAYLRVAGICIYVDELVSTEVHNVAAAESLGSPYGRLPRVSSVSAFGAFSYLDPYALPRPCYMG